MHWYKVTLRSKSANIEKSVELQAHNASDAQTCAIPKLWKIGSRKEPPSDMECDVDCIEPPNWVDGSADAIAKMQQALKGTR